MELLELQTLLSTPKEHVTKTQEMAPFIPDEAINFEPEQYKVVIDSA